MPLLLLPSIKFSNGKTRRVLVRMTYLEVAFFDVWTLAQMSSIATRELRHPVTPIVTGSVLIHPVVAPGMRRSQQSMRSFLYMLAVFAEAAKEGLLDTTIVLCDPLLSFSSTACPLCLTSETGSSAVHIIQRSKMDSRIEADRA